MLGVIIMMNNYMHDLATALLATSGIVLWVLGQKSEAYPGGEARAYFVACYHRLTRLGAISLVWIILGGAVRSWSYREFEWANAVGNAQVPALIVKHVLMFGLLGLGLSVWGKLRAKVRRYEEQASQASAQQTAQA